MSGTIVLKKERGKYRYTLQDEKGAIAMKGAFFGEKEKVLTYIKMMQSADSIDENLTPLKGPDGKWAFKGFFHSCGEGARDTNITDAVPLGYSPTTYDKEEDMEKARQVAIKVARGADFKDES
jgi:hypothetical protein